MLLTSGRAAVRTSAPCRRRVVVRSQATPEASGPFVIVDIPPTRKSAAEPTAVPVVHSPAYFLQVEENNLLSDAVEEEKETEQNEDDEEDSAVKNFEENPVDWVLTTTDQMLNDMERNPNAATETLWRISNSPIGKGTAASVRTAAKVTLKAGQRSVSIKHSRVSCVLISRSRGSQNGSARWNVGAQRRRLSCHTDSCLIKKGEMRR